MNNEVVYTQSELDAITKYKVAEASKGTSTNIRTKGTSKGTDKPKNDIIVDLLNSKSKSHFIVQLIYMWMAYKKSTRDEVSKSLVHNWKKFSKEECNMVTFESLEEDIFPYVVSVELEDPTSILAIAFSIHNILKDAGGKSDEMYGVVESELNKALIEQLNNEEALIQGEFNAHVIGTKGVFAPDSPEWNALLIGDSKGWFMLNNRIKK